MKSIFRFLLFLVLVLGVLSGFVFTLHNTAPTGLWLGTDLTPRPLALWILLAFGCGGVLGLLLGLGLWRRLQNRVQVMQLRGRLQQAEKELAAMKQQSQTTLPRPHP